MSSKSPITPPPKFASLTPDTSLVPRFTSQNNFLTGGLTKGRQAVLKDLKRYLRVPYLTFIHSVFGTAPDTSQIRQRLIDERVLKITHDGPRWSRFTDKPSAMTATEDVVFEPLAAIISKIFSQVPDCPFECYANPHSTPPLSERGNTSYPDAYIKCSSPKKTHWFDIVVSFEFKKTNNPSGAQDNEQKMVWNLHSVMREDPLRRLALGITVEDTSMRLWYHSRALLVVSEPIDFTTAIDNVISLFSLIGSKTKVELGWDPTVERIIVDGKTQYKFEIDGQFFTTTRPLSTLGADAMVGRGTRVYEALDEHGNLVAIKDSWRDEDREPEGKILEMIFQDIRKFFTEKEAKTAERYFVRVQVYEDVSVSGQIDKMLNPGDGTWVDIDDQPILPEKRYSSSVGHIPDCGHPPPRITQRAPRLSHEVPVKIHTRTVYHDVGITLTDVTSLHDCFSCLSDSGNALYYTHKAGWVHRDFSVTNIFWVPEGDAWVGKLSDFEFAKKVNSEISHDVRTGTMDFMAVEVASETYLNAPEDMEEASNPPFRMNLLHDLESQWWTATWILFYYTDTNSPTEIPDEQRRSYDKAFPFTFNTADRANFFMKRNLLLQAYETLSETYKNRCRCVLDLARSLHEFYRQVEKPYPYISVENTHLEEAHKIASKCYADVAKSLRKPQTDISLRPLHIYAKKRCSEVLDESPTKKKRSNDSHDRPGGWCT